MQSERYTMQDETNRRGFEPSMSQRLAYATDRANILFACYRRGDAHDPDAYVAAITAVLSLFDPDIIREATDPRLGISTTEKFRAFMPNSGELKAYCDALADRKERLKQLAAIPRLIPASHRLEAPEAPQGSCANVFVPEGHPRYARLCDWTKTTEPKFWKFGVSSDNRSGLWVSLDVWEGNTQARPKPQSKPDWSSLKLRPETLATMAERIEPEQGH